MKCDSSCKKLYLSLLNFNLIITLGAIAMIAHTYIFIEYYNFLYLISISVGVITFYNFNFIYNNRILAAISLLTILITILNSGLSAFSNILLFLSFVITFCYHYSIKNFNLRRIPYLKLLIISSVWVILTLIIPVLEKNELLERGDIFFLLERFIFLISMALLFDLRDIDFDIQNKLKTIPNRIGVFYTKFLVLVLLTLWFILCLIVYSGMIHTVVTSTFLIGTLSVLLVSRKWERTTYILIFDGLILMHSTFMSIMLSELF